MLPDDFGRRHNSTGGKLVECREVCLHSLAATARDAHFARTVRKDNTVALVTDDSG